MEESADTGELINNRYKIGEKIGEGSMGHVHKVIDTKDGRALATKFLTSEMLKNKRTVAALKNEFKIAKRFDNCNIVKIYDFILYKGNYYLIMDYIEGESLREHLSEVKLSLKDKLEITIGISLGLSYMHGIHYAKGTSPPILHGDIKPENVMIRDKEEIARGNIVWTDFGFSVLEGRSPLGRLFHRRRMKGTPLYMSPEQIRGDNLDVRSDLYSLGVLSYEIYAGRPPFLSSLQEKHFRKTGKFQYSEREGVEMAENLKKGYRQEITTKHLRSKVRRPRDFNPTIPASIEDIIMKCLQKHRKERPDSIYEVLSVLYKPAALSASKTGKESR